MTGLILGQGLARDARQTIGFTGREASGPGRKSGDLITSSGESHFLVIGPTGAGKSTGFAMPNLLSCDANPIIAVDIKGELQAVTRKHRERLGPVLTLDPFHILPETTSSGFNPLEALSVADPDFEDGLLALTSMLTEGTSKDGSGLTDAIFWYDWAAMVISGLLAMTFSCEEECHHHLGRAYELFSGDDVPYNLARRLDSYKSRLHPMAATNLSGFLSLPEITRGGVLSTVMQTLRVLSSAGVRDCLKSGPMKAADIRAGDTPFTIYLVFPPNRLHSHAPLLRTLLTSFANLITSRRQRPAHPTLILADEAGQLGSMPSLVSLTTLGRGYGARVMWMVQSLGQLQSAYGITAATIQENCDVLCLGPMKSYSMAKAITDTLLGDVNPADLFALPADQAFIGLSGEASQQIGKCDYRKVPSLARRADQNPFYAREKAK